MKFTHCCTQLAYKRVLRFRLTIKIDSHMCKAHLIKISTTRFPRLQTNCPILFPSYTQQRENILPYLFQYTLSEIDDTQALPSWKNMQGVWNLQKEPSKIWINRICIMVILKSGSVYSLCSFILLTGAYHFFITPLHQYLFSPSASFEATPTPTGQSMPKLSSNGKFNVFMILI